MNDYTMFKKSLNGFDKDEVLEYIQNQEDEHNQKTAALEKEIKRRDKVISELKNRIVMKDDQVNKLESDIKNKYQKYIDNYQQIGELIYESRIKGDQIVTEAQAQADKMLSDADEEAKRRVTSVQNDIDAKLTDGKKKYLAVQDEMNDIVELFNQMQKKFMTSYKEVHEIIQSMPGSLNEFGIGVDDDDFDDGDLDLTRLGINFDDDLDLDDEEELDAD